MITIVGGGLAGSEAAWQAASLGVPVTLYEMRRAISGGEDDEEARTTDPLQQ